MISRTVAGLLMMWAGTVLAAPNLVHVVDTPFPPGACIEQAARLGEVGKAVLLSALLPLGIGAAGCANLKTNTIYVSLGPIGYLWAANGLTTPDGILGHEIEHILYGPNTHTHQAQQWQPESH